MSYFLFCFNFLASQFLGAFFRQSTLMLLWHLIYLMINLQASAPLQYEKNLLWGYLVFFLWAFSFATRKVFFFFPLDDSLEKYFKLDFRLFNFREFREGSFDQLTKGKWSTPWKKMLGATHRSLWLLTLCVFVIHAYFHQPFKENLSKVLGSDNKSNVHLFLPEKVLEGEKLFAIYQGDFLEGDLSIIGNGDGLEKKMTPGTNLILERMQEDLEWVANFREGRTHVKINGMIKVLKQPRLASIKTMVKHPQLARKDTYDGVTDLVALPGSHISISVDSTDDQDLQKIKKLKGKFTVNEGPTSNSQRLFFIARENKEIVFQLVNNRDQIGPETIQMNFTVPKNMPPTISISKPKELLEITRLGLVQAEGFASDDLMLKALQLKISHFVNFQKQAIKTISIDLSSKIKGLPQALVPFTLDLNRIDLLPGNHIEYFLEVEDLYDLKARSKKFKIRYLSMAELFAQREMQTEKIKSKLNREQGQVRELKKELQKMEINAQQGGLKQEQIQEFQNKIAKMQQAVKENSKALEKMSEQRAAKDGVEISENALQKIQDIRETLESIDKEFLSKINQNLEPLLRDMNLRPEEVAKALKDFLSDDLEKKLDEVLRSLEQLKQLEKLDNLEKLAENLYQQHEDLRAFSAAKQNPRFYNSQKKQIENLFRELLLAYQQNKKNLNFEDNESKELLAQLDELITMDKLDQYRAFKNSESSLQELNEHSDRFRTMKENLNLLAKRNRSINMEASMLEISRQVNAFLHQTKWINDFVSDDIYDLKQTHLTVLNQNAGDFVANLEEYTGRSKSTLYDLLAGHIPGIIRFFNGYELLMNRGDQLKKELDPSSSMIPVPIIRTRSQLSQLRSNYLFFVNQLLQLKEFLREQSNQANRQGDTSSAMQQQQSMGQSLQRSMGESKSGKLNQQQMEFLKQSAMEQSFIRSLMEGLRKGMQQDTGEPNGESANNQKEGMLGELTKLIEDMEEMEEALKEVKPEDKQKILSMQKKIESNLKKFERGIQPQGKEKKSEERKSKSSKSLFVGSDNEIDQRLKYMLEGLDKKVNSKSYPKSYETRIRKYLEAIQQKVNSF